MRWPWGLSDAEVLDLTLAVALFSALAIVEPLIMAAGPTVSACGSSPRPYFRRPASVSHLSDFLAAPRCPRTTGPVLPPISTPQGRSQAQALLLPVPRLATVLTVSHQLRERASHLSNQTHLGSRLGLGLRGVDPGFVGHTAGNLRRDLGRLCAGVSEGICAPLQEGVGM
jgi:hypothetical protein